MKTRKHQRENLSGIRRSKWSRNGFGVPPHFLTWFLYSSPFRNISLLEIASSSSVSDVPRWVLVVLRNVAESEA